MINVPVIYANQIETFSLDPAADEARFPLVDRADVGVDGLRLVEILETWDPVKLRSRSSEFTTLRAIFSYCINL